jgi:hypothetical protein
MVGAADQISLALLKQLLAISDGAAQLKHRTILNANTQTNRGLRQRSSKRQAPKRLENVGDTSTSISTGTASISHNENVFRRANIACNPSIAHTLKRFHDQTAKFERTEFPS